MGLRLPYQARERGGECATTSPPPSWYDRQPIFWSFCPVCWYGYHTKPRWSEVQGGARTTVEQGLQLGVYLGREELQAGLVVGRFGEVDDRVGDADAGQFRQPLGDLLGRADERAFGQVLHLRFRPVSRNVLRVVRAEPGEPVLHVLLRLADDHVVVGGADDLAEVRPHVGAVLAEDLGLVLEDVGRAVEVRVIGVLGGGPQRLLLAPAGDPQRDAAFVDRQRLADGAVHLVVLALQGGRALGPQLPHDLDALVEHGQALAGRREAVAVRAPLVLVPARADAHVGPAAGDHVDRRGDLGQVGRVPVG